MPAQNWKKQFAILWCGQATSLFTSSVLQMAIIWYLTEKTGSAAVLSFATLVGFLPQAILGTFIGALIDRYDRKTIMLLADGSVALLGVLLALSGMWGEIPIWLIMVVLCLRSVGTAFHYPSLQALTPSIVPKKELTRYAGFAQSFESVSMILSPALAAVLFSLWPLEAIILIDVAGAAFAAFMLCFIRLPKVSRVKPEKRQRLLQETIEGLRIMRQVSGLRELLIVGAVYALIYFPIGTLYPLITMTYFSGSVAQSGLVEVLFASGSLLGSLILGLMATKINKIFAISASIGIYGAGLLITGLLPPGGFRIFAMLSLIMGLSVPFYTGIQTAIFQLKIREEYLGRIFSLSSSVSMVAMPLGLVLSGTFAEMMGIEKWFLFSGVFTVALAVVTLLLPSLKDCCET